MTPERIARLRKVFRDDMYGCTDYEAELQDALRECLDEIERLKALLPPSDDGEPVTADWLIESGFAGEHELGGCFTLHVYSDGSCSIDCDSGPGVWYRFEESCDLPPIKTRGDARRLAAVFGVKLREGGK